MCKLKKFTDYMTSKSFKKTLRTFLIIVVILGGVTFFYLYVANMFSGMRDTSIDIREPKVSDVGVVENIQFESSPFVILEWYTDEESITSYKVTGSGLNMTYSDTTKYKKYHKVSLLLSENSFSNKYTYQIITEDKDGNKGSSDLYSFTTQSKKIDIVSESVVIE